MEQEKRSGLEGGKLSDRPEFSRQCSYREKETLESCQVSQD